MLEFNSIHGFDKIIFDYKEQESSEILVITLLKIKLMLRNKILGLNLSIPRNYPYEPIVFSKGNVMMNLDANLGKKVICLQI